MPKKPPPHVSERQAKIQAVSKQSSGGANKIVVAAVVVVVAIIAVVGGVIWQQSRVKASTSSAAPPTTPGSTSTIKMGEGFTVVFPGVQLVDGAPTLDIFEDFQCPACGQFEGAFKPTIEELAKAGKVKLVYHIKNFLDDNLRNDSSTRAGVGAFCAAEAGKFLEYHDQLYAHQPAQEGQGWTDAELTSFAEQAGLSGTELTTWKSCFAEQKYASYIVSVEKASFADGVKGTPTIRINGKQIELSQLVSDDGKAFDPAKLIALVQQATT